jgi:hypothetical protein
MQANSNTVLHRVWLNPHHMLNVLAPPRDERAFRRAFYKLPTSYTNFIEIHKQLDGTTAFKRHD